MEAEIAFNELLYIFLKISFNTNCYAHMYLWRIYVVGFGRKGVVQIS